MRIFWSDEELIKDADKAFENWIINNSFSDSPAVSYWQENARNNLKLFYKMNELLVKKLEIALNMNIDSYLRYISHTQERNHGFTFAYEVTWQGNQQEFDKRRAEIFVPVTYLCTCTLKEFQLDKILEPRSWSGEWVHNKYNCYDPTVIKTYKEKMSFIDFAKFLLEIWS